MRRPPYPNTAAALPDRQGAAQPPPATAPGQAGQLDALICTKNFDHPDGNTAAVELLLTSGLAGNWECRPRCARHPAAADARLLAKVSPAIRFVIIDLRHQLAAASGGQALPDDGPGPDTWWVIDHDGDCGGASLLCGTCIGQLRCVLNRSGHQLLDPQPEKWGGECCDGCGKALVIPDVVAIGDDSRAGVSQVVQP